MSIEMTFLENGFIKSKETKKAIEYYNENLDLYVYDHKHNTLITIVIDPFIAAEYDLTKYNAKLFHSSNVTKFPTRMNKGQRAIHYGVMIKFNAEKNLSDFLQMLTLKIERKSDLESVFYELEGKRTFIYTTKYERKLKNRMLAIELHGLKCEVCSFDFEKTYGELGKDFIEVHHMVPLHSLDEEIQVNPKTDLCCLCSNCHRMIHRKHNKVLSVEELKQIINENIER